MPPKFSSDAYTTLARDKGYKWLSLELPKDTSQKTSWECASGHVFSASYNKLSRGRGCPHCAGNYPKRNMPHLYYAIAASRGYEWVGEIPPKTTFTNTLWKCPSGHIWEATYHALVVGNNCKYCSRNMRFDDDYHALAKSLKYQWVGNHAPKRVIDRTQWMCDQGHGWETSFHNINRGNRCPICGCRVPKTTFDYHELAKDCEIKWVADELPPDTMHRTLWQCQHGHVWETSYSNIKQGTRCPTCQTYANGRKASKTQFKIAEMVNGVVNYRHEKGAIDVAIEINGLNIGIEYDCWYWHSNRQGKDLQRIQSFIDTGWKIIHIKANEMIPTYTQLQEAIETVLSGANYVEMILDWKELH